MTLNVAYYISSFGMGHISRAIPIIKKLLQKGIVHVKTHKKGLLSIHANIGLHPNLRTYNQIFDVWLQYKGITPNYLESIEYAYKFYQQQQRKIIESERNFLQKNKINLIIADIPTLLDLLSKHYEIPVIGISNFDWGKLFEYLAIKIDNPKLEKIVETLKSSYQKYDLHIALPLNKGLISKNEKKEVGFYTRIATRTREEIVKSLNIKDSQLIVFVSYGMSLPIPTSLLTDKLLNHEELEIITSNNGEIIKNERIHYIPPSDFMSQDYIAASDLYIGKPGWGTLSECYCYNVPLVLFEFEENLEWKVLAKEMKKCLKETITIPVREIEDIDIYSYVEKMLGQKKKINQSKRYEKAKFISNRSLSQIERLILDFVE
ncbi:MAG: glycosyltransferase family protein [Candidatus Heimdallarchaeaceae archaeon]